jgi:hypothetical protein
VEINPETLILIVVGAHLNAEVTDRPLAYRLCELIDDWRHMHDVADEALHPMVCTDLWYLNHNDLLLQPTLAIGDPEFNATTAFLANRIPTALVVDQSIRIHLDPELVELRACAWGVDPAQTTAAVETFCERYLDDFLRAAYHLPEQA